MNKMNLESTIEMTEAENREQPSKNYSPICWTNLLERLATAPGLMDTPLGRFIIILFKYLYII